MAKTKWATVIEHEELGGNVHRVHCQADEPLGHVPGNYVILRSTLVNPDKPMTCEACALYFQRCRSEGTTPILLHSDRCRSDERLAVPEAGDRLEPGPWGKFKVQEGDVDGPVHLFATGTGFSPIGAMALERTRSGTASVSVGGKQSTGTTKTFSPFSIQTRFSHLLERI